MGTRSPLVPKRRPGTEVERTAGRAGAMIQHRGPKDPATIEAVRTYGAARLAEYVQKLVADFPPLTDAQIERVVTLLRSGGGSDETP